MNTRALLIDLYGPLLTYAQLAKVLDRTIGGLKASLSKRNSASGRVLGSARVRIGRRVYFRTERIAELLDGKHETNEGEGA